MELEPLNAETQDKTNIKRRWAEPSKQGSRRKPRPHPCQEQAWEQPSIDRENPGEVSRPGKGTMSGDYNERARSKPNSIGTPKLGK